MEMGCTMERTSKPPDILPYLTDNYWYIMGTNEWGSNCPVPGCADPENNLRIYLENGKLKAECLAGCSDQAVGEAMQGRIAAYRSRNGNNNQTGRIDQGPTKPRFNLRPAAQFIREARLPEFLVEPLLVKNQPAVICGASKTLKTSVATDLAVSLATRTRFLGKFWVPEPVRVCFFSGESGQSTLSNLLRRVCADRDTDHEANLSNLFMDDTLPRLNRPADLCEARDAIMDHKADVVIFDPLYLMDTSAKANSLDDRGSMFRGLNEVCHDAGATLVIIHHTVKNPGYGVRDKYAPPEREDMHGAGVIEWARQWALLGRRERYAEGTGQHALWFSVGGSAGQGGLWELDVDEGEFDMETRSLQKWAVDIRTAGDGRAAREQAQADADQERLSADCREIIAVLQAAGVQSKSSIKDATFGGKRFERAWAHLIETETVLPIPGGIKRSNGQSYLAFKVNDRD